MPFREFRRGMNLDVLFDISSGDIELPKDLQKPRYVLLARMRRQRVQLLLPEVGNVDRVGYLVIVDGNVVGWNPGGPGPICAH